MYFFSKYIVYMKYRYIYEFFVFFLEKIIWFVYYVFKKSIVIVVFWELIVNLKYVFIF